MDHDREDPLTAGEDDDEYEGYIYEEADEDDDDDDEYNDDGNDHTNVEDMEDDEDYEDEEDEEDVDDDDDDNDEENYIDEDVDEDDDEDTGTMSLAELFSEGHPNMIRQLLMLMQSAQSGNGLPLHARRRVRTPSPIPEPDTEKGNEILNSGEFGRVDSAYIPSKDNRKNITRKLWMRELKPRTVNPLSIGESIIPDNPGKVIDAYRESAYSGQYSEDGSLFASCDKDWQLRIYKTAGNKLVREKLMRGMAGRWTITDHNLSLDNHWLIYSSITPHVYLTRTAADAPDTHHLLDFSTGDEDYALWSVRFSGDGREIVAGGKGKIYVYDIESRTVLHSVKAHQDDVNSVCFAEPTSSQVVFSGSDDHLVKVWDRRSMGAGRYSTPSGVLVGHAEGITYVTSKGDNRYLASNGKDQKMLLWDLRMMHSNRDYSKLPKTRASDFDYRSDQYRGSKATKIPGDCSVMTFQGHRVLRTLIRCHFSPVHSTGQRYLYTGSADGKVAIYRMDGTRVRTLDTSEAFQKYTQSERKTPYVARDVSWHPYHPTILSSCLTDRFSYHEVGGGIVQHTFTRPGNFEPEVSETSDTEPPPPPRQRRRFLY
ncbi:hypothetical protein BGZ97_000162 [Linnemannia gamsii]|uniref:WD40 repeat-like protein n=1 Tax=Linnemannia gamsii TaxID=64522 RepID=A0A9P6RHI9_9FUNG|nr:hypothetical protein BGZ97_000162 [Linnemannia gamsii]